MLLEHHGCLVNAPSHVPLLYIKVGLIRPPVEVPDRLLEQQQANIQRLKYYSHFEMNFALLQLSIVSIMFISFSAADSLQHRGMPWRPLLLPHFSSGRLRPAVDHQDVMCLALRDWAVISSSCNNDAVEILKVIFACFT